jgi:hypothetical protein
MSEHDPGEGRGPNGAEGSFVRRLVRRAAGWPTLVATAGPRMARLQARAAAGRRPLLEAVAQRWRVGDGKSAWPAAARLPLALPRVPRTALAPAEPVPHRSRAKDRETPAPIAPASGAPTPPLRAVESPPAPTPTSSPSAPSPAPPAPGSLAAPLLRRVAGSPVFRAPLRATTRPDRLALPLARRDGPPTQRSAPRAERGGIAPLTAATPSAALPVGAPELTSREHAAADTPPLAVRLETVVTRDRATVVRREAVAPLAQPPAAVRVPAMPLRAAGVLGRTPSTGPRPADRAVSSPRRRATAEVFAWPVLLPLARAAEATTSAPAPLGRPERVVPAVGEVPAPRAPIPVPPPIEASADAPPAAWPTDTLPLAHRGTGVTRTAAAETSPAPRPQQAVRAADAAPFSADARPHPQLPQAGVDAPARSEQRAARIKTHRLADQVYDLIVRRLEDERMRRGL